MKLKFLLFTSLSLISIYIYGQSEVLLNASNSIKINDLKQKLYKYSSDEFEGRGTPSKGQELAVGYLADHYKKLKIPSLKKDSYFQAVPLQFEDKPSISLSISNKNFNYYKDYISYSNGPDLKDESIELVYLEYGIDDPKYNNYKGKNVVGKFVVAIGGEPLDDNGNYFLNGNIKSKWSNSRLEITNKKIAAKKNGALGLILVDEYQYREYTYRHLNSDNGKDEKRMTLSNIEENNFQVLIFSERHEDFLSSNNLKMNISFKKNVQTFTADNVAAIIKGSEFPDEYVILTAHLDHVGIQNGEIYNGADDDGSGTVAIMEIAEAFALAKEQGHSPKRSIIFLHVTAEERGLLGSQYYADYEPIVPLNKTIANLNIDMIGRADPNRGVRNLNYIYIIGSDILSNDLHKINLEANKDFANLELDFRYNDINDPNEFYYRSDHFHFVKYNIPAIFYFSGVHEDYHQPTDTADKILYNIYNKRVKLIFHTAWGLANRDNRIELN